VEKLYKEGSVNANLYHLVCKPLRTVRRYSGYVVNGFRFHTLDRQENRNCQNSGVMVRGDDYSDKEYYGVLRDVYELQYPNGNHVFAFKCDWYDVHHQGRGYKIDEYGITSVHSRQSLSTDEPFVLESQVEQVFYVREPEDKDWLVVIKTEPRDLYKMPEISVEEDTLEQVDNDPVQQEEVQHSTCHTRPSALGEDICLATNDFMVERGVEVANWVNKEIENIKQRRKGKSTKKKSRKKQNRQGTDLDDFIVGDDVQV